MSGSNGSYFKVKEPIYHSGNPLALGGLVTSGSYYVFAFQIVIAILILISIICMCVLMTNTSTMPAPLTGAVGRDYDALQVTRQAFSDLSGYDPTQPMIGYRVLTANFGGIFTEDPSLLSPWNGSVSARAAQLQVEAGARAIVLDIWPNPADMTQPVVCAMMDLTQNNVQNWWLGNGLNNSVSRYSNWNAVTRNTVPAGDIIQAAITAAFAGNPGKQNSDPFFLILKLHGAMTTAYLNTLGSLVNAQVQDKGYAMNSRYATCKNQNVMNTASITDFNNVACVIVIPDIQTTYDSLPGINTYAAFTPAFLATTLGEATNYLEQAPQTVFFEPSGISSITSNSLATKGFCVVQPSIGSTATTNDALFTTDYGSCLKSGAQFVAVNLFSPSNVSTKSDSNSTLSLVFDPSRFGTFSFSKI